MSFSPSWHLPEGGRFRSTRQSSGIPSARAFSPSIRSPASRTWYSLLRERAICWRRNLSSSMITIFFRVSCGVRKKDAEGGAHSGCTFHFNLSLMEGKDLLTGEQAQAETLFLRGNK